MNSEVSVIIPVKNGANSIANVISRIKGSLSSYSYEIIVVDDGSKDETREIAESNGAIVISHERSVGKGAAMKTGVNNATSNVIVFLDGDGAHYPENIPDVIAPILQNKAGLVIGSRAFSAPRVTVSYLLRRLANSLSSLVISIVISFFLPLVTLFRCPMRWAKIADAQSGFKAIKRGNWQKLDLTCHGFEIESEIIYEAALDGLVIEGVPISYNQDSGLSHLSVLRDGGKTLKLLVRKLVKDIGGRRAVNCS